MSEVSHKEEPSKLKLAIILSGKRKSGKDHVASKLVDYVKKHNRLDELAILRVAGPIKETYAKTHELDLDKLLDSSEYKETYRKGMVEWSENYREQVGLNCFLEQSIASQNAYNKSIWMLIDARRKCDLEYFDNLLQDPQRVLKVRIQAKESTRCNRGWKFTDGIDNKPTECGLDEINDWTYIIDNDEDQNANSDELAIMKGLRPILEKIDKVLSNSW